MEPTATTAASTSASDTHDHLQLVDVDHVRFCVGNAKQAAFFYAMAFGFQVRQFSDLTTGDRQMARYFLEQGNIRFILETPLQPDHPATEELRRYGDGIKDVAFNVQDAEKAYERAVSNGAESAHEPQTFSDADGAVTTASIKTYGRAVHTFVSRTGEYSLKKLRHDGLFLPGWQRMDFTFNEYNRKHPCGLKFVDHCVGNVEEGRMNHWVDWYENVLEFKMFKHFDDADISTEHSALMSKVMASGNHLIKMPINEPAEGLKKSQIQEYLEWHSDTPGVQHLALRTDDELASVAELRRRGVDFLQLPDTYYELVWDRVNA
ncbi:MAG: 4-hydroxyphenylpyruvate dioxygenase, partial [Planctomycetota bacterium]|nr:4-hydroxyphenylpyruvate dioxygenase [Planctomycetota bacterium]